MKMEWNNAPYIKRKISNIKRRISTPINTLIGLRVLKKIVSRKLDEDLVIILSNSLGDQIYGLAYVDEIKLKNPNKSIVVISSKKFSYFLKNYVGIDKLLYKEDLDFLTNDEIDSYICSSYASEKGLKYDIYNATVAFYKKCYNANNPDLLYQLRSHVFNIDEERKDDITYPIFDSITELSIKPDKNKTIILNPYSNSLAGTNMLMWESIANKLNTKGYDLYTNAYGDQKTISGTKRLDCKMDEIFAICKHIKAVISIRSGFTDAIVSSNVDMVVIYDRVDQNWRKMHSLESWNAKGRVCEIETNQVSLNELINKVELFLNEAKNGK